MRLYRFPIAAALILFVFVGCEKDDNTYDTTPKFYFVKGSTSNFDDNLVLFSSSDTVKLNLVISSSFIKPKETLVTIAVDDAYRTRYNTDNGTAYAAMPAAAYDFDETLTAGTSSINDTLVVSINKQLLSGEDFLLPLRITSVTNDYKIDSAFSVIYLHTKGNILSGKYVAAGSRILYHGDAGNGDTASTESFTINKNLLPINADTSQLDYANLGVNGWKYLMLLQADGKLKVLPNNVITQSVFENSFQVTTEDFDPETKALHIITRYKNLSGDERIVEESLTLQ